MGVVEVAANPTIWTTSGQSTERQDAWNFDVEVTRRARCKPSNAFSWDASTANEVTDHWRVCAEVCFIGEAVHRSPK